MTEQRVQGAHLAAFALALCLGSGAQLQQPALWPGATYVVTLSLGGSVGLALALWRGRPRWTGWLIALVLASAAFAATGLRAHARLADTLRAELEGRDLVLTGMVSQLPRRLSDGVRFVFEVESAVTPEGQPHQVPRRLSLGWYGGWQEESLWLAPHEALAAGQRWRLPVRLKRPHGTQNPHGFDQELWLFERGIGASGHVRALRAGDARLIDAAAGAPVERLRERVREAIGARVADGRAAGVLAALAVGDQAAIERADWDIYRATGIAHLVSISGLHVAMFAWLAAALIGRAWRGSERLMLWLPAAVAARWGGLAAAAGYALVAGWGVPAQRTVWMLAAAAVLAQLGLRWPWPLVLAAVAAVVATIDPWALLQPGFWLSFVAVGLLLLAEPAAPRAAQPGLAQRFAQTLRHGLRTQVVATLGLAPLTLLFFQQVSLVGLAANLVAIPLVTLLITPLALAGVLLPPLWQLGAWLVQALTSVLAALAALPGAVWTAAAAPWWMQAAALIGALLLIAPLPWRVRALALPLMLPLFAPPSERPPEGAMQVIVADVGQGSAVLVRTRGHALLHDSGPRSSPDSDACTRVLVPLLRGLGVARLDVLMLSHRDLDHVGGAASLMAALPVERVSSSLEAGHPLRDAARAHQRCQAGQAWRWDGVDFRVLHPAAEAYARTDARPNTLSCVLAVTDARGQRLLLTGDLEAEQEAHLVREDPQALRSQVLLAPHHGSQTSSSAAFLDAVAPATAIVQAGYRNRFGHPAAAVLERYRERGITVLASPRCGAWSWRSDMRDASAACQRDQARRYWHWQP